MTDLLDIPEILPTLLERCSRPRTQPDAIADFAELGRLIVEQASRFSLRDLERLSEGRLKRTFLQRCVTAHRMGRSCPAVLEFRRLSISHLDTVGKLARPLQCRLLIEAEGRGWSVRELRAAARSERGRCPSAEVGAARRSLRAFGDSLEALARQRESMDPFTLANLLEMQAELERACELTEQLLSQETPRCA